MVTDSELTQHWNPSGKTVLPRSTFKTSLDEFLDFNDVTLLPLELNLQMMVHPPDYG